MPLRKSLGFSGLRFIICKKEGIRGLNMGSVDGI